MAYYSQNHVISSTKIMWYGRHKTYLPLDCLKDVPSTSWVVLLFLSQVTSWISMSPDILDKQIVELGWLYQRNGHFWISTACWRSESKNVKNVVKTTHYMPIIDKGPISRLCPWSTPNFSWQPERICNTKGTKSKRAGRKERKEARKKIRNG